ncbi:MULTISPECIES: creatininase [Paeniglutamicibacter]|uniref:Creatinine amidohydrolase n=1 Tax=Paeniglutamicibacter sulfureus TaxID=43666 RepID=A0ABU2BIH6_9MICC|nr:MULTISPECIES: creatininase [Paeniglutamicibacter]MCV9993172.1 creatininase [Paeniglutamicibacter sp. ZC-3]MDO2933982.1 creatininase [Paeniglutamicibacter sulfureus]MDR7357764.1 creatinine amidohydrolase [Paeniglutamicibacter sulfureus]
MASVFLEDLDAETYAAVVAREGSTVIIPTGATEQHGPHMPLGVDAMLSKAIAGVVAEKTGAVVAPVFAYGYKSQPRSGGGNHRVGTTSLGAAALTGMVDDVVSSFLAQGFNHVVVLNGHFENYQFIYEGLDNAVARARKHGTGSRALLLSYWDFVDETTLEKVFPDGFLGWDIEHGGVLETSLMLLLHPEKVDMSRVVDHPPAKLTPYDIFPEDPARTPDSGCLSSAKGASAERGQLLLDAVVTQIADALKGELLLGDIALEVS